METTTENANIVLWVITEDLIGGDRVGYGQTMRDTNATMDAHDSMRRQIFVSDDLTREAIPSDKRIKFKALDDDGETYYKGVINADAFLNLGIFEDDEDDYGYELDRFCMEDAGAVHTLYNRADIAKHKPEYAARHTGSRYGDEWLEVYG